MSTAHDMIELLRRHYIRKPDVPAGIFATEIEAPGGRRRADLMWLGVTASSGRELVGHEVKVSRADVLAELADPTKSDPWMRYAHRWWLVVPHASLIDGLDIPERWGVMTPPTRGRAMTVHRPAPRLTPDDQVPALRAVAAWVHWRHRDAAAAAAAHAAAVERERERASDAERRAGPRESPAAKREHDVVAAIVRALGGVSDGRDGVVVVGDWRAHVDVDDVIAALRSLGEVRERADRLLLWARGVESKVAGFDSTLTLLRDAAAGVAAAAEAVPAPTDTHVRDDAPAVPA